MITPSASMSSTTVTKMKARAAGGAAMAFEASTGPCPLDTVGRMACTPSCATLPAMDDLDFHDARIRITRLLTEQDRLCARLEATERASSRLLQEINEL